MQRRAATLLHGLDEGSLSWEEYDFVHLADDERGDRTSLLLGGATGGVALKFHSGLIASAGTGTLFLTNLEKLGYASQSVLCSLLRARRYTPVGDPFPRPLGCRIIVGTQRPLSELARRLIVRWELSEALGHISLSAEEVLSVLETRGFYKSHSSSLAAAS
ncbi:MAG TPA: sigma 54-interacting transcriptional regulator [Pyrinomonadaceae bacterium]|nr:sigma 54-interacting transcriptional regulator [Pyrinomonadaceae bacterium]